MSKRTNAFIVILIIAVLFFIRMFTFFSDRASGNNSLDEKSFRNTSHIKLTKHAKCRMECRHITLDEIKEILQKGEENYAKSGEGSKGDKTYALEGYSIENQHIRVVVAPEKNENVIITCIDLDKEWPCNCN